MHRVAWCFAVCVVAASACTRAPLPTAASSESSGVAASAPTPTTRQVTTASWLNVGADIASHLPDPASGFGPYLSRPIDITTPGRYEFVAGPLLPKDADINRLHAISVPNDATDAFMFSIDPTAATIVQDGDAYYLHYPMVVSAVTSPYLGLAAWFQ